MKETALKRTQIGFETTRGTAVTPTVEVPLFDGDPQITPIVESETYRPAGSLAPASDARVTKRASGVTLPLIATWEQLQYWLNALFGTATAVDNGDGTYTRTWLAPTNSVPSVTPLTLVHGTDEAAVEVAGLVGQKISWSHNDAGAIKASLDFVAFPSGAGTLAALTSPTVTPIMGHTATLYVDAWSGTVGTTELTGVKFGCELSADVKAENEFGACSQTPLAVKYGIADGGLRMSLEYSAANSIVSAILAATDQAERRLVRIKYAAGVNVLTIDFAGSFNSAPQLYPDNDGIVSADLELAAMYNSTLGSWLKITLTNEVA